VIPRKNGGPLEGIRVLDFTRVLSGPFCTSILADLGAEVIKLEVPGHGDETRTIPPFIGGHYSHYFLVVNRNKKSVAIDFKKREASGIVERLVLKSDIVVENFRPGVMARLGFGYDKLRELKPDLIYCSISGFGQTGPLRDKPSYDLIIQALSGVMSITGDPNGEPMKLGIPMGDLGGGLWGSISVLAALHDRDLTGNGRYIDISLLDGMIGLLGYLAEMYLSTGENPGRMGTKHHIIVPYGGFEVKDGYLVLALHVGPFYRKFCSAINREDLIHDPRYRTTADRQKHRKELEAVVAEIMKTKTLAEWGRIFDAGDVPYAPILSVGEALERDQIKSRGLVEDLDLPMAGPVKVVGPVIRFPGAGHEVSLSPPPQLGEHTRMVLEQLGGFSKEDVDQLIDSGVIAVPVASEGQSKRNS
jgi:formyl-CoA transferase